MVDKLPGGAVPNVLTGANARTNANAPSDPGAPARPNAPSGPRGPARPNAPSGPGDPARPNAPSGGPARPNSDPAKIVNAAKQFEALLMGQLLKSMRETGSAGWLGTGDDSSSESAMELAEEQFAQALASRGGLGLAKLIAEGVTQRAQQDAQPAADVSGPAVPSSPKVAPQAFGAGVPESRR